MALFGSYGSDLAFIWASLKKKSNSSYNDKITFISNSTTWPFSYAYVTLSNSVLIFSKYSYNPKAKESIENLSNPSRFFTKSAAFSNDTP